MNKLRNSDLLNDLYRDLRDRRLLIPLVALLVAIVAVPLLLGRGGASQPEPPLAAPAGSSNDAEAVQPAVLAETAGIRNYRERLAALKQKNPFEQKFELPDPDSASTTSTSTSATDTSTSTSTGTSSSSISSTTSSTSPDLSSSTTSTPSTDSPSTTAPTDTGGGSPAQPEIRFYSSRVDVTVGPLGHTKRMRAVKPLDLLPDEQAPVVAFIGLAGAGEAVFSVSRDVSETDGEGSCAPKKPSPCEFLLLKVGEERTLKYGPEAKTYRLKVLDTDVVRVPDPRDQQPDGDPQSGAGKIAH